MFLHANDLVTTVNTSPPFFYRDLDARRHGETATTAATSTTATATGYGKYSHISLTYAVCTLLIALMFAAVESYSPSLTNIIQSHNVCEHPGIVRVRNRPADILLLCIAAAAGLVPVRVYPAHAVGPFTEALVTPTVSKRCG